MLIDAPFVYRRNPDRTIDSICTRCMATVCSVGTIPAVKEAERMHECPGLPPHLEEVLKSKQN